MCRHPCLIEQYPAIDGIIAPQLPTPFHDQGRHPDVARSILYEELILFHPQEALRHTEDRPLTPTVQYYYTTFPIGPVYVDPGLRPPRIRYRSPQHGGGPHIPAIRDTMGEEIAASPQRHKAYRAMVHGWSAGIRRVHRHCPWLRQALGCFPVLSPSRD